MSWPLAFVCTGCSKEVVDASRRRNHWHLQYTWFTIGGRTSKLVEWLLSHYTSCLHPNGHIAALVWDGIVRESWTEVCREAVAAILSKLNLELWQNSLMRSSLNDVQQRFTVDQNQAGFFSKPQRPDKEQTRTYEQREKDSQQSYEITRTAKSKRTPQNARVPEANRAPHVWRVLQDLMRLVHKMLPLERIHTLERIHKNDAESDKNKCWFHSETGAFNFATSDRVTQLAKDVDADWFYPGEDGVNCKYGLKANILWTQSSAEKVVVAQSRRKSHARSRPREHVLA